MRPMTSGRHVLLGANWYCNASTCSSELGWMLSGYDGVILAVAMRRARLRILRAESVVSGCKPRNVILGGRNAAHNCQWIVTYSTGQLGLLQGLPWSYILGKAVLFEKHALSWRGRVACHSCTPPYSVLPDVPGVVPVFIKSFSSQRRRNSWYVVGAGFAVVLSC